LKTKKDKEERKKRQLKSGLSSKRKRRQARIEGAE
jgi:hypothetical protein